MKNLLLTGFALAACASMAASDVWKAGDIEYNVDTLFHANVGPGTTQTSLHFSSESRNLRVFYLTVDLKNPVLDIRAVVAQDKLAGGATTSSMATSHSKEGVSYFAGINTDFFATSGTSTTGGSIVGTPTNAAVVDGEIYRTSERWKQFAMDADGVPVVGLASFAAGTAECGDKSVSFQVVNNTAADNALSIYTPRYYGRANQPSLAGKCAEVTAKLVEGDFLAAGKTTKFEVTGEVTSTGDREIPSGEYVLLARGTAMDFVNGLKVGDVVTVNSVVSIDGQQLIPEQLTSGNPRILGNGETLDTEGERGDASALHPRSGIGYTADADTLIMMVIDGRSAISSGVRTSELADVMRYAKATDAINIDGGGSSTLYTLPLGVRNATSDGHERAVGSAIFAVANAPEDKEIAEIRFVDWAMNFPKYGIYTPKFYGYNQYGMLVDTDVQGVTLSCDPKIGEVINDGTTFYGTGDGIGALKAQYNGLTADIPVTVAPSDNVAFRLEKVLLDNKREYTVEVNALVNETEMPMNSSALAWSSDNEAVATVEAGTGLLKGVSNGAAVVTGKVGDFTGTLNVSVEIPEADVMPVYREFGTAEDWTFRQVGGTDLAISQLGEGFKLNYVGNGSSRGAYISVDRRVDVWSLPEGLRISVNPGEVPVKKVSVTAMNALGELASSWAFTETELPKNELSTFSLSFKDIWDLSDVAIYPITITTLRFDLGTSAKGTAYEIQVPAYSALYTDPSGVNEVVNNGTMKLYPNPVATGTPVQLGTTADVEVYNLNGALVSSQKAVEAIATENLSAGVYVVTVKAEGSVKTAKLIVR